MQGFYSCAVHNLMATTKTTDHHGSTIGAIMDGREKALLADLHRHIIMLPLIAERAGHSATAGVDLADRYARHTVEQILHGGGAKKGFLMAMAVNENLAER